MVDIKILLTVSKPKMPHWFFFFVVVVVVFVLQRVKNQNEVKITGSKFYVSDVISGTRI